MSAVELLEQAKAEGILLVLDGERLSWEANHQPPAELLAEIKAHRLEIIARLKVANESPEALAWLACVADLLRCSPDYLLLHGFVDRHDLAEQHQQEPWRAARLIRTDPRWR